MRSGVQGSGFLNIDMTWSGQLHAPVALYPGTKRHRHLFLRGSVGPKARLDEVAREEIPTNCLAAIT